MAILPIKLQIATPLSHDLQVYSIPMAGLAMMDETITVVFSPLPDWGRVRERSKRGWGLPLNPWQ